jgi:nucleotide-binding universal stress UspA family protein
LTGVKPGRGVPAELHRFRDEPRDVGAALLRLAAEREVHLLVMGCYGHSRAREWALGGVTRSVLRALPLPALMSH